MANNKCKDCGCSCKRCLLSDHDVQLHVEIENLKQRLLEKENHIVMMETNFLNETNKFPSGEMGVLKEELLTWQDKYKRLYEAHRRVQRVNQGLEDKLLKLVDVCETDKNTLTKDVATLSHSLAEANYAIKKLTEDNERYKNDVNLAIQFLQCKQTNFVVHRFDTLPSEVQTQVSTYMNNKRKPNEEKKVQLEPKSIKVPIPTFPPTAMVYSVPKSPKPDRKIEHDPEQPEVDIVSAAIMAKVLEERQRERALAKHCDTCTCSKSLKIIYDVTHHNVGTQTGEYKENVCLKCNEVVVPASVGMQLIPVEEKTKKPPLYPNVVPLAQPSDQTTQNIVKVQPNNFLIDKTKSLSNPSNHSTNDSNLNTTKNDFSIENNQNSDKIDQTSKDLIDFQQISMTNVNEKLSVHHKLCDKLSPTFQIVSDQEKAQSETNIDKSSGKNLSPDNFKGPRYCSMRVQSGSKNILLDNAHSNIAPVLYTRTHSNNKIKPQSQTTPKPITITHKKETHSITSHKQLSLTSENSTQHQQRVSDWVQVTLENDNVSSPDNSRTDDLKTDPKKGPQNLDRVRYAEMEENVKRFLFGESEFLKTVEIGKLKYKSYREGEKGSLNGSREGSKTSSHTETEI